MKEEPALDKIYLKKYASLNKGFVPIRLKKITNHEVIKCYAILSSYVRRDENDVTNYINLYDLFRAKERMKMGEHELFRLMHMYPIFKRCIICGQLIGFKIFDRHYMHFLNIYRKRFSKGAGIGIEGEVSVEE